MLVNKFSLKSVCKQLPSILTPKYIHIAVTIVILLQDLCTTFRRSMRRGAIHHVSALKCNVLPRTKRLTSSCDSRLLRSDMRPPWKKSGDDVFSIGEYRFDISVRQGSGFLLRFLTFRVRVSAHKSRRVASKWIHTITDVWSRNVKIIF
jgi:hypothetical protein